MSDEWFFRTEWSTHAIEPPDTLEQRIETDRLRLLGTVAHVSGQGIAILTPAVEEIGPRIAFVNDGFCAMYRRTRDEMIGATPAIFGIVEQHSVFYDALMQHVFDCKAFDADVTARRRDGTTFELELQLVPVTDGGQLTHWVAFLRDVSDSKQQLMQLRHQAMHDALTDLPNRALLWERFEKALENARGLPTLVALMLMDLDRFKEVNDTFGHHFGDVLLKQVALRLCNQVRATETVARLGGDEFAIVLPSAGDANEVAQTARRILNTLQQPFVVESQVLEVGASIGIALYPQHGNDARTLMRRADVAMYAAKTAQIGYSFHSATREQRSPDQLSLIVELRNAVAKNQFELYYQPKLHLRTGLMTRVEVLLRWNHPVRGLLLPAAFMPAAERTGIIKSITDWILDRALFEVRRWHDEGAPVHIAVNISAKSLQEQSLPQKLQVLLDKWKVDPRFVKIEITESSIMADPAHALAIMSMLQSMGIRLSVDDFGTGYSSLTHLRELPIDEIKIDKSFVHGMATSDADAAIVRAVIHLAHDLGKQVCAEGVEDEATQQRLTDMGCDLAQGYWIARPLPALELDRWIADNAWGLKLKK